MSAFEHIPPTSNISIYQVFSAIQVGRTYDVNYNSTNLDQSERRRFFIPQAKGRILFDSPQNKREIYSCGVELGNYDDLNLIEAGVATMQVETTEPNSIDIEQKPSINKVEEKLSSKSNNSNSKKRAFVEDTKQEKNKIVNGVKSNTENQASKSKANLAKNPYISSQSNSLKTNPSSSKVMNTIASPSSAIGNKETSNGTLAVGQTSGKAAAMARMKAMGMDWPEEEELPGFSSNQNNTNDKISAKSTQQVLSRQRKLQANKKQY